MFALRDFQYRDLATGRDVKVKQGERVDGELLARNKCNIEKLEGVRFVASGEAPSTGYKRRGRPKKTK